MIDSVLQRMTEIQNAEIGEAAKEAVREIETKVYTDGTTATGVAPLPELSPAQQDAEERAVEGLDLGRGSAFRVTEPYAVLAARVNDLESRLERLIDHVNKEIGVAQDVPLYERLECLEKLLSVTREKIKEKTKLLD